MNTHKRHRFPPEMISYAVWLCYRVNLSYRDIEDLLAERGITVSREAIRLWCIKCGALYARQKETAWQVAPWLAVPEGAGQGLPFLSREDGPESGR